MRRAAGCLICGCLAATLFASPSRSDSGADQQPPAPNENAVPLPPVPPTPTGHWYDVVAKLPFLPIPEIGQDPDSGTTVGVLPVWLITDEQQRIRRIIAPDLIYNPNFGVGAHARIYDYPSADRQWSVETGIKQRVEREFDFEYQLGRLRQDSWSFTGSAIYDRSGAPRFFGIGNGTPQRNETNFTNQQQLLQVQIGYNFTHAWQLQYTARWRKVEILPGTLNKIDSIEKRFPDVPGLGTRYEQLNRLAIIYDTRDDLTAPRRGMTWIAYGGVASDHGILNNSLYSEAGIDGRVFWPINPETVLATHVSLRYLPSHARDLPFWALSTIGGGQSIVGGTQPLRGFGEGRFYDRNAFSATAELRRVIFSFDAISHVDVELAPFVDVGNVFHQAETLPVHGLHKVVGVGFRAIARPSVVGYVDVGYGSDGTAVFTGINYPF